MGAGRGVSVIGQRPTIPSTPFDGLRAPRAWSRGGLLAVAYIFLGIRPDRYASRPAMTACFIASAIAIGSCAPAPKGLTRGPDAVGK